MTVSRLPVSSPPGRPGEASPLISDAPSLHPNRDATLTSIYHPAKVPLTLHPELSWLNPGLYPQVFQSV